MRKPQLVCLPLFALILVSIACATPKPGIENPTSGQVSFQSKTITLVSNSSPGSGSDIVARTYARHFSKFLPGNPTIVVRNMPGGAGTIGPNYVYTTKPDGLTGITGGGLLLGPAVVKAKEARYDLMKMPLIIAATAGSVFFIRPGIIDKPNDLFKAKGLVFGYSGGAAGWTFIVAKELLGIPADKVTLAYPGAGDARRAFLAGELNMVGANAPVFHETMADYVAKGEVMLAFQTGILDDKGDLVRDPSLPAVPTPKELYEELNGKSPSGTTWEAYKAMVAAGTNYDAAFFLAPGTPDGIVKAYWTAAEHMLKDTEFTKDAARLYGKGAVVKAGMATDKEFKLNFGMKPEVRDWLVGTLGKYGVVVD